VAVDAAGNLYIADTQNDMVEKVTPSGRLSVVAGNGDWGAPSPGPATSSDLKGPSGVAVDATGDLYIADTWNSVVEKVTPSGTLSVVGRTRHFGAPTPGPATSSDLNEPSGVAVDSAGNLYIGDYANNVVEKVTPSGTLSVVAGTGRPGAPTPGPATSSDLWFPSGLAVDAAGDLYIADYANNVVEKVTPSGTLLVVAGTGDRGAPTPGPATSSELDGPGGVAVDSAGNLYIADSRNNVVDEVAIPAVSPSAVSLLVVVGVAVPLVAGILVFLVSRRRSTGRTVVPPAAGGPPSFTPPPSPPSSP
jgi:streptogramin lyase